jgi:glycosyltransferase involved in cell wall biosynthesis
VKLHGTPERRDAIIAAVDGGPAQWAWMWSARQARARRASQSAFGKATRFRSKTFGAGERNKSKKAARVGIERVVRFLGYVPNAEILEWLQAGRVDAVALPSDWEGIPVSLIEALAHGVPAAASEVGGVAELLGDGCGLLVPEGDRAALADAIRRLLRSPQLREDVSRAGRERVEREFAVDRVVTELRTLLGLTAR